MLHPKGAAQSRIVIVSGPALDATAEGERRPRRPVGIGRARRLEIQSRPDEVTIQIRAAGLVDHHGLEGARRQQVPLHAARIGQALRHGHAIDHGQVVFGVQTPVGGVEPFAARGGIHPADERTT